MRTKRGAQVVVVPEDRPEPERQDRTDRHGIGQNPLVRRRVARQPVGLVDGACPDLDLIDGHRRDQRPDVAEVDDLDGAPVHPLGLRRLASVRNDAVHVPALDPIGGGVALDGGADLLHYALRLGLEPYRFESDLSGEIFARRVSDDFRGGVRSGVNGTPTFFINGVRYNGPHDYESLKAALESAE